MTLNRLQDDLLQDFREQKQAINAQIELFDPLATSLRRPAAQRLMSKGVLVFFESMFYLLCVTSIVFTIFMNLIPPFRGQFHNVRYVDSVNDMQYTMNELFSITVHALAAFIALLFFIMARMTRRMRLKNDILDLAGNNIKILMGQHLKRKASIDAIEQRHFLELPTYNESVEVNEVPNPGYEH